MRGFRGCQQSWHLKLPDIYEGVIDARVKSVFSFRVDSILKWRVYIS